MVAVAIAIIVFANQLTGRLNGLLQVELSPRTEPMFHRLLMISSAAYTLLIAIPFVPAVEIGFTLLLLFGAKIVFLLYLCTLLGLSASFLAGFFLPASVMQKFLSDLSLRRASALVGQIDAMSTAERLQFIVSHPLLRHTPSLLRYRYLAAALALNVPGNAVIGGGGGIVFVAGLSHLFSPPAFIATLAIAIAPVPLAVLFFGEGIILP